MPFFKLHTLWDAPVYQSYFKTIGESSYERYNKKLHDKTFLNLSMFLD